MVSTNRTIGSALEELHLKDHLKNLRPDIVLRNHEKIVLIDVACPYDLFLDELSDRKLNIYLELNYEINKTVKCEVLPFIVGSTGLVHKKCLKTLMSLGIPNRQAKGLCKWCKFYLQGIFGTFGADWLKITDFIGILNIGLP